MLTISLVKKRNSKFKGKKKQRTINKSLQILASIISKQIVNNDWQKSNQSSQRREKAMNLREELEKLNGDAERWDPAPGEILVGCVKGLREIKTQYGLGKVADIETKDGVFTVFLSAVLQTKFIQNEVSEGDRVGIKYLGEIESRGGRSYKNFAVLTEENNGSKDKFKKSNSISSSDDQ